MEFPKLKYKSTSDQHHQLRVDASNILHVLPFSKTVWTKNKSKGYIAKELTLTFKFKELFIQQKTLITCGLSPQTCRGRKSSQSFCFSYMLLRNVCSTLKEIFFSI